jgi:hypothetical protein
MDVTRQGNRKTPRRGASVTRRRVLQSGAAVAALPATLAAGAAPVGPVMAALSSYMSAARERALPDDVAEKTKHHVLDTFAAMISGSQLAPGRAAIKFARGYGGEHLATVAGSDVLCGPIEAALANGVLAHADETDDSHAPSLSHPGCAVVPAALAVGEALGIDGRHFLRAVALGYDVGPRVTMCLGVPALSRDAHLSSHPAPSARPPPPVAPPRLTRNACAGSLTTPRSSPPASPPGSATAITSRRRSSSAACRRAAG